MAVKKRKGNPTQAAAEQKKAGKFDSAKIKPVEEDVVEEVQEEEEDESEDEQTEQPPAKHVRMSPSFLVY